MKGIARLTTLPTRATFDWGLWVEVPKDEFFRAHDLWQTEGREDEAPIKGQLANDLTPIYEPTIGLPVELHFAPVGERPVIVGKPDDHQLTFDLANGITPAERERIAEALIHSQSPYSFDGDREVQEVMCGGCGVAHPEITGFILREGDAHAVYRAVLHGRPDGRVVYFDVAFGSWHDDEIDDHVTFGCKFCLIDGNPACSLVTGGRGLPESRVWGSKLTREQALEHVLVPEFWSVIDFVMLNDPGVVEFVAPLVE